MEMADKKDFEHQMERLMQATATRTQVDLADFLGISQSSVSDARRRGKIPAEWLLTIMRAKGVLPEWILTGNGPCHVNAAQAPGHYETGDAAAELREKRDALQKLSSRELADELLRRIAVS